MLSVFTGAILAHRLGGDPVWLLLVTPPGGTKTELIRTLYGYRGIYPLSDLTARTFASGLDKGDPSLLARSTDEILVLKDFTTILERPRDERQAILAQFREIYDGRFDKVWGTGREFTWMGRLGFVAGVTPVIDQHQAAMSVLGPRFITFRPIMPDRQKLARYVIGGGGREADMRVELAAAMHGFLRSRTSDPPIVRSWVVRHLATMADLVTRARSPVHRDGRRRDLQYAPEAEAPTRLGKVLRSLGSGIAMAHDRLELTGRELALVGRVALDTVPGLRHRIVKALLKETSRRDPTLQTGDVIRFAKCSKSAALRSLEDLHALGVVERDGFRSACEWAIRARFADVLRPFGSRA
jgi:hypothetical protein